MVMAAMIAAINRSCLFLIRRTLLIKELIAEQN